MIEWIQRKRPFLRVCDPRLCQVAIKKDAQPHLRFTSLKPYLSQGSGRLPYVLIIRFFKLLEVKHILHHNSDCLNLKSWQNFYFSSWLR